MKRRGEVDEEEVGEGVRERLGGGREMLGEGRERLTCCRKMIAEMPMSHVPLKRK